MGKRFTDSEKWNKRFIRSLKPAYKLLWFFITDECNSAGIWEVDFDVAKLKIGMSVIEADAIKFFDDKIKIIDGGNKWFIPSFIEFQYGELNEANRAHTKIISLLKKFKLIDENLKPLTSPLTSPFTVPSEGTKVEDKEMDMVEEQEEEMEQGAKNELRFPFNSEVFLHMWGIWKTYKKNQFKFEYKDLAGQQAALNKLVRLSGGHEEVAIKIIEESISNGWKGFFELNHSNNGSGQTNSKNNKPATGANVSLQSAFSAIDAMHSKPQG